MAIAKKPNSKPLSDTDADKFIARGIIEVQSQDAKAIQELTNLAAIAFR